MSTLRDALRMLVRSCDQDWTAIDVLDGEERVLVLVVRDPVMVRLLRAWLREPRLLGSERGEA